MSRLKLEQHWWVLAHPEECSFPLPLVLLEKCCQYFPCGSILSLDGCSSVFVWQCQSHNLPISCSASDTKSISQPGFRRSHHSVPIVWSYRQKAAESPWCRSDKSTKRCAPLFQSVSPPRVLYLSSICSSPACRQSLTEKVLGRASCCSFPITDAWP